MKTSKWNIQGFARTYVLNAVLPLRLFRSAYATSLTRAFSLRPPSSCLCFFDRLVLLCALPSIGVCDAQSQQVEAEEECLINRVSGNDSLLHKQACLCFAVGDLRWRSVCVCAKDGLSCLTAVMCFHMMQERCCCAFLGVIEIKRGGLRTTRPSPSYIISAGAVAFNTAYCKVNPKSGFIA